MDVSLATAECLNWNETNPAKCMPSDDDNVYATAEYIPIAYSGAVIKLKSKKWIEYSYIHRIRQRGADFLEREGSWVTDNDNNNYAYNYNYTYAWTSLDGQEDVLMLHIHLNTKSDEVVELLLSQSRTPPQVTLFE